MTSNQQPYRGSSGSPIRFDTSTKIPATRRQTEDGIPVRSVRPVRPSPQVDDLPFDDCWEPIKSHTSALRYDRSPVPPRRSARLEENPKQTRRIRQPRPLDRWTLLTWLCLAIIVMAGGWWLFSTIGSWWQGVQENWRYGYPRTAQADQYMGLGDSPAHPDHFIVLNLHGVIDLIRLDPQDSHHDTVYVLASVGNDHTPASLSFRDTTGSGHTDVIVTIGDSTSYSIILINDGTKLTPTQPAH